MHLIQLTYFHFIAFDIYFGYGYLNDELRYDSPFLDIELLIKNFSNGFFLLTKHNINIGIGNILSGFLFVQKNIINESMQ